MSDVPKTVPHTEAKTFDAGNEAKALEGLMRGTAFDQGNHDFKASQTLMDEVSKQWFSMTPDQRTQTANSIDSSQYNSLKTMKDGNGNVIGLDLGLGNNAQEVVLFQNKDKQSQ